MQLWFFHSNALITFSPGHAPIHPYPFSPHLSSSRIHSPSNLHQERRSLQERKHTHIYTTKQNTTTLSKILTPKLDKATQHDDKTVDEIIIGIVIDTPVPIVRSPTISSIYKWQYICRLSGAVMTTGQNTNLWVQNIIKSHFIFHWFFSAAGSGRRRNVFRKHRENHR